MSTTMAEDIDALLDEMESKYLKETQHDIKKSLTVTPQNSRSYDEDIQMAMADILSNTDPLPDATDKGNPNISDKQCFPVLLCGTSNSGITSRICDRLRCTSCDFDVLWFNNHEWKSTTDYLFLRNNMPDRNRLVLGLNCKTGCRAYACQCQWRSITKPTDVRMQTGLKWVCGKH